jgi:GYF domain 2
MSSQYYYARNGQRQGPVPGARLKELVAAGTLARTDHICREGETKWVPAGQVKGLFIEELETVVPAEEPPPFVDPAPGIQGATLPMDRCQCCGQVAPTRYVVFYQNIGLLIMRQGKKIEGQLCKACIDKHFWEFTLITFLAGWWGVISFFLTPFFLINNVVRYLGCVGMRAGSDGKEANSKLARSSRERRPR